MRKLYNTYNNLSKFIKLVYSNISKPTSNLFLILLSVWFYLNLLLPLYNLIPNLSSLLWLLYFLHMLRLMLYLLIEHYYWVIYETYYRFTFILLIHCCYFYIRYFCVTPYTTCTLLVVELHKPVLQLSFRLHPNPFFTLLSEMYFQPFNIQKIHLIKIYIYYAKIIMRCTYDLLITADTLW